MSLVYLVTSLPTLKFPEAPKISKLEFLERTLDSELSHGPEVYFLLLLETLEETSRIYAKCSLENLNDADTRDQILNHRNYIIPAMREINFAPWVFEPCEHHILLRHWFNDVYKSKKISAHSFLKIFSKYILNIEGAQSGLLAKKIKSSKDEFLTQTQGSFDSTTEVMLKYFEADDLGLSRRFSWFEKLAKVLDIKDYHRRSVALNKLKWDVVQELKPIDLFTKDFIVAYFFELRLLERQNSYSFEKGQIILDNIFEQTLGQLAC